VFAALAIAALTAPAASAGPSFFWTGFADGVYENSPSTSNTWFDRTVATGAHFVLLPVSWSGIAPNRPPRGTDPTSPSNSAYHWGNLDQAVRGAVAHGLTVAFTVAGAGGGPAWADGPHRPSWADPGTWKPNATAFGDFMKAVARRYSGHFSPVLLGSPLPWVRYYQPWSEPNLFDHLNPQWVKVHGRWVPESADIYRGLLNSAYSAVKSVNGRNIVITGGTAPFGDAPQGGAGRVPPATFVQELLCLRTDRLIKEPCPQPAHFDILAHHPYSISGPWWHAFNADDVSLPDFGKLTRVLRAAERSGRALPRGHKQLWVTEFSWDSKPPDPQAVPMSTWEHWVEESFYVVWHQGVSAMAWFLIQDEPCSPNCADTYQSGMYFVNGRPKPGRQAFLFPFVVERASHGRVILWGISPRGGTLHVQRGVSHGWRNVATFHVGAHGIFTRTIGLSGKPLMRAEVGSERSLTWRAP